MTQGRHAWLVTGGAGYIGAHVMRALLDAGYPPVAYDNLSTGRPGFVPGGAPLIHADVLDTGAITEALRLHDCAGVIHCAGFKYAGESVERPLHTYQQNVAGTMSVLAAMADAGVTSLVFSSSAGVYGSPDDDLVTEESPCTPDSPYGRSKLIAEWLIRDQVRSTASGSAPLRATSLRYFNVAGSGPDGVPDVSPHNVIPRVLRMIAAGKSPRINGDDYPTPDGTCVRDYVHVVDVARSHVAAVTALADGRALAPAYNLGSGTGTSVKELMDAIGRVTGHTQPVQVGPRRPGDPARIVASGALAARDLDWAHRHTIDDMVASAVEAHDAA